MRDAAFGLRRTPLPRTPVNRGKEKGRGCYTPALLALFPSLSSQAGRCESQLGLLSHFPLLVRFTSHTTSPSLLLSFAEASKLGA